LADYKRKPLEGKRVVITRAPEQAQELARRLEDWGAEILLLPAVSFGVPDDTAQLDAALRELGQFDWILFTSRNAVCFFVQRCRALGLDAAVWQSPEARVGIVGPATAAEAREEGLRVDHVAVQFRGEALATELHDSLTGCRVLLPRSDRAGEELPSALRVAGAEVVEVTAYRTVKPQRSDAGVIERVRRGEADVVAFASPSAFHHFAEEIGVEALERLGRSVRFAAIGATTARAIREAGRAVEIEATESTSAGLAAAIASYYVQQTGVKSR
jgi:uroporphyrinogen III methyltransferase / synthase